MKLITLQILLLCFHMTSAKDLSENINKYERVQKRVKELVEKGWTFYAFKNSQIYLLNGKYRYTKINFEEFYSPKNFKLFSKDINPNTIGKDVVYYYKKNHQIILRKEKDFFKMVDDEIKAFDPLKDKQLRQR